MILFILSIFNAKHASFHTISSQRSELLLLFLLSEPGRTIRQSVQSTSETQAEPTKRVIWILCLCFVIALTVNVKSTHGRQQLWHNFNTFALFGLVSLHFCPLFPCPGPGTFSVLFHSSEGSFKRNYMLSSTIISISRPRTIHGKSSQSYGFHSLDLLQLLFQGEFFCKRSTCPLHT